MIEDQDFLPVSQDEMHERGWWWYDFLLVTGDAYVDHPSFGPAVISRVLEADGFRVAVLAQPDWHSAADFAAFGRPRLGVLIGAGNLDSMVAHYTAAKKRRSEDFYSPGKKAGLRRLWRGSRRSHGIGNAGHDRLRRDSVRLGLIHASGHLLHGLKTRGFGKLDIIGGIVGKGI